MFPVRDKTLDTQRWRRVRARQLAREPLCRICREEGRDRPAREVDHIKTRATGGAPFDPANLQSLCTPCHSRKTALDKAGRDWASQGYDEHGFPRDPAHPWNMGRCVA